MQTRLLRGAIRLSGGAWSKNLRLYGVGSFTRQLYSILLIRQTGMYRSNGEGKGRMCVQRGCVYIANMHCYDMLTALRFVHIM